MMFFYCCGGLGNLDLLGRLQTWLLKRLLPFSSVSGDVRWTIVLLALRLCIAIWVFGRRRLAHWIRNRGEPGGSVGAAMSDAASTVAAGQS